MSKQVDSVHHFANSRQRMYVAFLSGLILIGVFGGMLVTTFVRPTVSTVYYHYNLQYNCAESDDRNQIIESMSHVIEMYSRHPNWNYTIETQFMTIEWMEMFFPSVFGELQRQNQRGQLELIVLQYSNAWNIGYPLEPFKLSLNYTHVRMAEYGLIPSRLILLQEGQWMPGFLELTDLGFFDAYIIHREQLGYFGAYPKSPVLEYSYNGKSGHVFVDLRIPRTEAGVWHLQIYAADGELLNTGDVVVDVGPASAFQYNAEKQRSHEEHLLALERKGNRFMRIDDFYRLCLEKGAVGTLDKFIPEVEWVPNQYGQFMTWMGWGAGETDDGTHLARCYRSWQLLQATMTLLDHAYESGVVSSEQYREWGMWRINGLDGLLLNASKFLWEAQVSDTTGITPPYRSYIYGLNKTYLASQICFDVVNRIRSIEISGGNWYANRIQINPISDNVVKGSQYFINNTYLETLTLNEIKSEFGCNISYSQDPAFRIPSHDHTPIFEKRHYETIDWGLDFYRLQIEFDGKYNITNPHDIFLDIPESVRNSDYIWSDVTTENQILISFEDDWSQAIYSPSLVENFTQTLSRTDYYQYPVSADFEFLCLLALSNGFLYNPQKGYGIVKNVTGSHLAASWRPESISFPAYYLKYHTTAEFFLVKGTIQEVLQFANQINTYSPLTLEAL
jgi:hypothetical protein